MLNTTHGSKNLLQRAILYRHEKNYCGREDSRQYTKKTICKHGMVFLDFLWIDHFVWALALCGLRICHCASVDCSGTAGKIHMREIEVAQGPAHDDEKSRIS